MTTETLSTLRRVALAIAGLIALAYGAAALVMERPDPVAWHFPLLAGLGAAIVIALAALWSGERVARAATDEAYRHDERRAAGLAYWVALLLYPVCAIPLSQGAIAFETAFAAMGTLSAAAYLLLFVWFDMRGR